MRTFSYLVIAMMAIATFSACSFPLSDDIHIRGSSSYGDSEYIAMDNAIYDTLVEMYGKDRVELSEAPEVEFHRWSVRTDLRSQGNAKSRTMIEGRPLKSSRTGHYQPDIRVAKEFHREPWGRMGEPHHAGANSWVDGGKDTKAESKIYNEVERKMRAWRKAGRPEVTNRRDEYLNAMEGAEPTKKEAAGK